MADVALILRVMPKSPDIDLEQLKDTIRNSVANVHDIQEEPIGFSCLRMGAVVQHL